MKRALLRIVVVVAVAIALVLVVPDLVLTAAPVDASTTPAGLSARCTAAILLAVLGHVILGIPAMSYRRVPLRELGELRSGTLWHFTSQPIHEPGDEHLVLQVARCRMLSRVFIRHGIRRRLVPSKVVCAFAGPPKLRWLNVSGKCSRYVYVLDAAVLPDSTYRRDEALAVAHDLRAPILWHGLKTDLAASVY